MSFRRTAGKIQGAEERRPGCASTDVGQDRRQGFGVQEFRDGSQYEGGFVNGLKHGKGKYTWKSGEFYEGSFFKDYRHGDGMYCWPTGDKFIGKFYLNWKEGYGQHTFPDGATFKGLYHNDQRFGPGVLSEPTGCQDVGLWHGKHLIQMCSSVQGSFSLKNLKEYAAFLEQTYILHPHSQIETDDSLLLYDDNAILPDGIENYSTDGDHLPLPPTNRREFDQHFFGHLWEPDSDPYDGYKRDPYANLPLQSRMLAHIHRHRRQTETLDWGVAEVLSLKRDHFGPKGFLEVTSELLIQQASRGEQQAVKKILLNGLAHPDVGDSHGHTALIAATVNCHDDVIQLLLDMGADIDKLNCEGLSPLSVCHFLYYPLQCLYLLPGTPVQTQDLMSLNWKQPQTSLEDFTRDIFIQNNTPQTSDTVQTSWDLLSDQTQEDLSGRIIFHCSSCSEHSNVSDELETPAQYQELKERGKEDRVEINQQRKWKGTYSGKEQVKNRNEDGGLTQLKILTEEEWRDREDQRIQKEKHNCNKNSPLTPAQSVNSYSLEVSEEILQGAAEALSHTGLPQHLDTQETVRRMAAMKFQHRVRLCTLKLLLDRGADPNISKVPLPVLFLAIMAADTETVRNLLLCGARTDICLSPEWKGIYPLHVAAALPGPEGPKITELLLHALSDPDAQACDWDEIYEPDKVSIMTKNSCSTSDSSWPEEGGQTALHIACQRKTDHCNASKVVSLLLSHGGRTDLLWSGHSPLSLAIANGNDMAVEELLKGGADPNIPLGYRVGNALCVVSNFRYYLDGKREKLLDMLQKAGADMLKPVQVGDTIGNVIDYGHHSFDQDLRIAHTPFHILNIEERETLKSRRYLLSTMGSLLRESAVQREKELEKEKDLLLGCESALSSIDTNSSQKIKTAGKLRSPSFKFCYDCGRSAAVKLTACTRCRKVFYCSTTCKLKAWNKRHREECLQESASVDSCRRTHMFQTQQDHQQQAIILKSMKISRHPNIQLKSKIIGLDVLKKQLVNVNENYSYN
ncbi:ankyrin repeat and MYND domain-containing protein 1-like isoform X3 [Syngnathoides biaculeatus]|uniref:ankyrin repeat and MYND domain-containing protein 1-like isoform X3 n=1 Tax=Syngnathoides biaculeatus TaxID=300417 RepID=UPI002ADE12B6|nr:ankyrin repeat and MYND domain-containing protein 1-like isoform X3 [Syngnathoides biaculeatus]